MMHGRMFALRRAVALTCPTDMVPMRYEKRKPRLRSPSRLVRVFGEHLGDTVVQGTVLWTASERTPAPDSSTEDRA